MKPERFRELEAVYFELIGLSPEERESRLAALPDASLRDEVRELFEATSPNDFSQIIGSTASSFLETLHPERFGPWRVTGVLGHGGMGAVYRAVRDDGAYRREVAIKVLATGTVAGNVRDRFLQERQILATLDHPNIAHMLDGGESQTGSYIVLECIDGADIVSYCNTHKLSIQDRLRLFLPVCAAVQYAHDHGVLHRDLKPANVLVTQHGTPKLLDFGIAKVLEQSTLETVMGYQAFTPQYASPEQIGGGPLAPATDVYSLGALLYELLTGARPYEIISGDPAELVRVIGEQDVRRPSTIVPGFNRDLELILLKALQKQPARRYASVGLFAADLRHFLDGHPIVARPDSVAYRLMVFMRRHAVAAISSLLVFALAVVFAIRVFNRSAPAPNYTIVPFTGFAGTEVNPNFSPDGSQVAFAWNGDTGDFNLYTKRLGTGFLTKLTQGPYQNVDPAWSPDGRQIAFLRLLPNRILVMIKTIGGSERQLASSAPPEREWTPSSTEFAWYRPAWSRDGKNLVVVDVCPTTERSCLYLVSVLTGQKKLLTNPGPRMVGDRMPSFSPDGRTLAFSRSKTLTVADIYIQSIATHNLTRLTFDESELEGLTWNSNGREILFSSSRSGKPQLWRISMSGGAPHRVDFGGRQALQPAIAPSGGKLAFVEDVNYQNIWETRIHDGGGSRATKLVWSSDQNDSPRYSPDGQSLAFASDRTGVWEIWVSRADGGDPRQVTSFRAGLSGSPRWSPDSRQIAFDSRQEDYSGIYIVPASGGTPKRITEKTSDNMLPCWSHDGQWIYFNSNRSGSREIWKKRLADGALVQITKDGAYEPYESSDGRYLYYWKFTGAGVWRISTQGGPEQFIPALTGYRSTRYFDVAKDGIYFVPNRREPYMIQFFDFANSRVSDVAEIHRGLVVGTPGLSVSPDEKWVAYAQVDYNSTDIFLVDHFK